MVLKRVQREEQTKDFVGSFGEEWNSGTKNKCFSS